MKKITSLLAAFVAVSAVAQSYEVRILTFEDADVKGIVNYNGGVNTWSSLIDSQQYGGPMLYPSEEDYEDGYLYGWYDEGNTEIMSEFTDLWGDGKFWGGGIAVSNFVDADLNNGDPAHQLAVPKSNGSANFAIVYCNDNPTISEYNPQTYMIFADDKARVIKSIKVGPTTYQLNVAKNGNGYASALTHEGDYEKITFYGYNGETPTGSVSFYLAKDGTFVEDWTEVSLESLGAVTMVFFTMDSSDVNIYGNCQPSYFAMDDIKVYFEVKSSDEPTSVQNISVNVVSTEFYTIAGQRISAPQNGVTIVKQILSDGSVKTFKQISK